MDDLALDGAHRLELDALARARAVGGAQGHRLERRGASRPIAGGVDDHGLPLAGLVAGDNGVREVLDRIDRLAVPADQDAEVVARADGGDGLLVLGHVDPAADADPVRDQRDHVADARRELRLVARRARLRRGVDRRDDPRRGVPDAEEAPLAFGDDLEAHRRLVELRIERLELAERGPLRLAHRLARRLDTQLGH